MDHEELLTKLKSPHPGDVVEALQEFEKQQNMHDLSLTITMIRNSNQLIKNAAIQSTVSIIKNSILASYQQLGLEGRLKLAQIIDKIHPDTVQELIKDINGPHEAQRVHGLMILGLMKRRPHVRRVIEGQLKSSNEKVRATAIQALGNYPDTSELVTLMKQLSDQDERVRANAIEALENVGDTKLVFSLKRLVNDNNNRVRANALKALYNLGHVQIENDIYHMLRDNSALMNASGLWLVAELGITNGDIIESCEALADHLDPVVQRNYKLAEVRLKEATQA